jgi:glycosyltransferase involved in cell wall biosynthesis
MSNIKVSVLMPTYNHEKFVSQAIESVLMQRTRFDYEIVVGEDCSTDRTPFIVQEIQVAHRDKVVVVSSANNIGPQRNFVRTFAACRGEYIALLEGDDFWTSPDKLQKQVDFLDTYTDCTTVFHDFIVVQGNGAPGESIISPPGRKARYQLQDIVRLNFIGTATVMFRKSVYSEFPQAFFRVKFADWILHVLSAEQGNLGYLGGEPMAAYRRHTGALCSSRDLLWQCEEHLRFYDILQGYLGLRCRRTIADCNFYWHYVRGLELCERSQNTEARVEALQCLTHLPLHRQVPQRLKIMSMAYSPRMFHLLARLGRSPQKYAP